MAFKLSDLNPEQREAVEHNQGPMLILAGAGTGKTRTITARIAHMVERGADPAKIIAVTFTNKAAGEMKERIRDMIRTEKGKLVTASTFHALCVRILKSDIHRLGYKRDFSILDEGDSIGLVKKIISRVTSKDEKADPAVIKNQISKAKNNGWRPDPENDSVIAEVFRQYHQDVKALNAVDFDDLLLLGVKLLDDFPEVRSFWQNKSQHIVVDEFQDTNRLQLELVRLLAYGKRPDVCVVGDDDQSIYGWRGAEISNILEFEHHFPNPKIIRLERNYRSTSQILEAANRLIRHNPQRREKSLRSMAGQGEDVRFLSVPDDKKEAEFIAGEIAEAQRKEARKWSDFAVLYRMNAQSRVFEETLRSRNIPYRLIGGQSFYDAREVKDMLAYLTLFAAPTSADPALLRVISTPPRGIGARTVELALAHSAEKRTSVFEAFCDPEFLENCIRKTRENIRQFCKEIEDAHHDIMLPGANPARVLSKFISECPYRDDLRKSCKTPEDFTNREENIDEFLRSTDEYFAQDRGTLRAFLDKIALDREKETEKDEDREAVLLITLHAAKGLEFPCVFLVGAEDGILPHSRSKEENTVEEERRIFYVGVTRAQRRLLITWCRQRQKRGMTQHCLPSPFLKEILGPGVSEENFEEIYNRLLPLEEASAEITALLARIAAGG